MESGKSSESSVAKIVILSSVLTCVLLCSLVFVFKEPLITVIFSQIEPRFSESIPDVPEYISDESRIISAIEKVNPTVVSVIVTKDVPVYEQYYENFDAWGLFGGIRIPRIRENGTEEREVGGGTGFIVSSDGLIVTNRHVVSDEDARYSIIMTDGVVYDVDVLALDTQLDIAILKISDTLEKTLSVATFGDSSQLRLGQSVIAIGNALAEFRNSVSVGVVSGLSRSIIASDEFGSSEELNQVIQTDAAINPGNSGGPLINLDGQVVGVNIATSQGADNIGFALPSSMVSQVVTSVREHGKIIRPYLGVRYLMLDEQSAEQNGADVTYGALLIATEEHVSAVEEDSAASRAGLRAGDIIISIDGQSLFNQDLATLLRTKSVGQTIEIEIMRDGVQETVLATLEEAL